MITVHTDHGTFNLDAAPTDIEHKAGTLVIKRDGQPIAKFRTWDSWHETTDKETNA